MTKDTVKGVFRKYPSSTSHDFEIIVNHDGKDKTLSFKQDVLGGKKPSEKPEKTFDLSVGGNAFLKQIIIAMNKTDEKSSVIEPTNIVLVMNTFTQDIATWQKLMSALRDGETLERFETTLQYESSSLEVVGGALLVTSKGTRVEIKCVANKAPSFSFTPKTK